MVRVLRWTDPWVQQLAHPKSGETIYPDPAVSGHRLIVSKTTKRFEIQRDRPKRFGERKTYKYQTGDALTGTSIKDARDKAIAAFAAISEGRSPRDNDPEPLAPPTISNFNGSPAMTTLDGAWQKFRNRNKLRPKTRELYTTVYDTHLKKWESETLVSLAMQPVKAEEEHRKITEERGPRAANLAMMLLRSIHRDAAKRDTALSAARHPCTSIEWNPEDPRKGAAVPADKMADWFRQVEVLRQKSPVRASFQILCLRTGCRPGELAARRWDDIDWDRKVLTIPESKTELIEVPLIDQIIAELECVKEAGQKLFPGNPHIFPRASGKHISRFIEPKDVLSHSGNCGRHGHHTIGTKVGLKHGMREIVLDALEGRSLLKAGLAGRGYLDSNELGPEIRAAQQAINDRIDELFAS